ncbi:hypothetical protein H7J77_07945 [Mycolicibacillus parakoreensis]|uniref:Uncharacterized protein n=1 Tax=Mycolicibacillus parakoreensis TaxID=1069221 RepID=A0ABY3U089_9MYCO|nr:hypothetical protein [Mycolicibacillus parakoreensis]MCV7315470.1 hypothetical protein [Mycolicibacillus parakoreensis]ULN52071.1 hypothetical protein MIU77_14555 [Mycolicibacillus parakoreensis]
MSVENAAVGSEYDEFPELEDRDVQNLARARVRKLMRTFMPADHPPATEYMLEVWMDGMATALRMTRDNDAVGTG